ncbi:MAG: VOC family protein [Pseudomonadota bacterium]
MAETVIKGLDHFVLYVADAEVTAAFYALHLGMAVQRFGPEGRLALSFGAQKINLHTVTAPFLPHADRPAAGAGDFCLLTDEPVEEVKARLEMEGLAVESGPVARTGATGPLRSIYLRDPDGNLVEISNRA